MCFVLIKGHNPRMKEKGEEESVEDREDKERRGERNP